MTLRGPERASGHTKSKPPMPAAGTLLSYLHRSTKRSVRPTLYPAMAPRLAGPPWAFSQPGKAVMSATAALSTPSWAASLALLGHWRR